MRGGECLLLSVRIGPTYKGLDLVQAHCCVGVNEEEVVER